MPQPNRPNRARFRMKGELMSIERQKKKLEKIIAMAQDLLSSLEKGASNGKRSPATGKRKRRSAEEAKKLRADVLSALKAKKSVAAIAKRHKVTPAYIYMLKSAA